MSIVHSSLGGHACIKIVDPCLILKFCGYGT
jgi:hypothetical protein